MNLSNYGGEWTGYVEWVEFMAERCSYRSKKIVDFSAWESYKNLTLKSGMRFMHEEFCIVCELPTFYKTELVNKVYRLHCTDGPAKDYNGQQQLWYIHGVAVTEQIVMRPETLTLDQIQNERNAEVRRVMIDRFGAARYVRESGMIVKHEDECGRLLHAPNTANTMMPDELVTVVEVLNSTPEPMSYVPSEGENGRFIGNRWHKHYMLRVPPYCKTAREAVAWTMQIPPEDYVPVLQT